MASGCIGVRPCPGCEIDDGNTTGLGRAEKNRCRLFVVLFHPDGLLEVKLVLPTRAVTSNRGFGSMNAPIIVVAALLCETPYGFVL